MSPEVFYEINRWILFGMLASVMLLATEVGVRLGRRRQPYVDELTRSQNSTMQSALLGLLALLLGFTFSMALARFDTRKQLVLEEANAIGTCYLRSQLLPQPYDREMADLLRQYVDVRLEFYRAGIEAQKMHAVYNETERLHQALWTRAVRIGTDDPRAVTTGLFLQALNDVIDMHAKRVTALRNHVPESILLVLCVVAMIAMTLVGYGSGLGGHRPLFATTATIFLIALVVTLIMDLDRPRRGFITVSQQSMLDLRDSLRPSTP